jgi:hypothetical protein
MLHEIVPDDGSDESKHVAHYCVAVKCCVWRCTLFEFQYQQMAALSIYTGDMSLDITKIITN